MAEDKGKELTWRANWARQARQARRSWPCRKHLDLVDEAAQPLDPSPVAACTCARIIHFAPAKEKCKVGDCTALDCLA
jgi:hypothetical protein